MLAAEIHSKRSLVRQTRGAFVRLKPTRLGTDRRVVADPAFPERQSDTLGTRMRTFIRRSALVFGAALGLAASVGLAAPRLENMMPHGVQRGTETEITLYGVNLSDAEELLIYDQGIQVTSFVPSEDEKTKGREVKVKLKVDSNAALGSHRVRVRSRTGLSNLQNIYVGALPIVEEKEPTSEFATPQAIANDSCVHGRVDSEDVDYYVVEAKKGERLTAEVYGLRLGLSSGGNFFDPYVAILNASRFELSANDDSALVWNDGIASIIVPEDGKYIIQIRDAAYTGDGRAYYLLNIGKFPRPRGIIPGGGKPGEKVSVKFLGDVGGEFVQEVQLPTEPMNRFLLNVQDGGGIAPSPHLFRVSELDNVIEQEPNEATSQITAPVPAAPVAFNGCLDKPGDQDYFKFTAKKGQVFDVEFFGRRLRSAADGVLYVCNKDGNGMASNDDSRGPDSYIRWTCPNDGEYSILVHDHLRNGGPAYTYRVEMTAVKPRLLASTVDFERYQQPQLVVPQGGGVGVQVTVTRQDCGGPVAFKSDDLPAGVSIECPEIWRGGATMPVVLYAAPDAPVAGKFSKILVHSADPNQPNLNVDGPLMQNVLMVLGPNQQSVWSEEQLRLPVVVSEALPFKVRIEAPKVPIVRGGALNLKVIAERSEDFKGPIRILLLQNPAGISSSNSVDIKENETEAIIPLNCNGNAPTGVWPIAVRAQAEMPQEGQPMPMPQQGGRRRRNGRVETCTPFVPITIEEQYVNFELSQAAVEQGKEAVMSAKVTKRKDFEGEAIATLVGLPANSTAEPVKITKETAEFTFTIKTAANTPPGNNQNLFCQVLVPENGDNVIHAVGKGRLRVDTPPPPKPNAPPPMPMPMAAAPPPMPAATPPKPLSRLEQLRLEQKQKDDAAKAAAGGK